MLRNVWRLFVTSNPPQLFLNASSSWGEQRPWSLRGLFWIALQSYDANYGVCKFFAKKNKKKWKNRSTFTLSHFHTFWTVKMLKKNTYIYINYYYPPLPPTFCILSQRKIGIFVAESRGKMDRKRGIFAQKWGKNFSKVVQHTKMCESVKVWK